jgi:hypothetical protein
LLLLFLWNQITFGPIVGLVKFGAQDASGSSLCGGGRVPEGVLGIATVLFGALFGALATYATQSFFNRARVYIEYAEIAYEDVFSLSVNTQQNIALYNTFVNYVDVQANWNFRRLLAANSFNRDELLVLQRICATFKGHQSQVFARVNNFLTMIDDPSKHEELSLC